MQAGEKCVNWTKHTEKKYKSSFQRIWDKAAPQRVQWWDFTTEENASEWSRSQSDYWLLFASKFAHIWFHIFDIFLSLVWILLSLQAPIICHTSLKMNGHHFIAQKVGVEILKCVWNWSPNGENMIPHTTNSFSCPPNTHALLSRLYSRK
jgi:hypothetical protein